LDNELGLTAFEGFNPLHSGRTLTTGDTSPIGQDSFCSKGFFMLKNTMTEKPIDLRELMELAGLTFKALGDRIGVNQAQVFRALSGEIKLRPESMKAMEMAIVEAARDRAAKLAAVLGVITPSASMWQEVPQGPEVRYRVSAP
jgi:hypothetical protein